ncbi:hypothetical protein, partial [Leptospira alexanderi]|uniref:hypothetical protein n=1 Tax=Leptospira alexanderi TaxID=100053 RepID=UPI001C376819
GQAAVDLGKAGTTAGLLKGIGKLYEGLFFPKTSSYGNLAGSAIEGAALKTEAFGKATLAASRATPEWKSPQLLEKHFEDHKADFGVSSPAEYAQKATNFLKTAKANGYEVKVDPRGITRVYDPQTNTFGAYNPDGSTATFFKPAPESASNLRGYDPTEYSSPLDYWNRAPINQGTHPW